MRGGAQAGCALHTHTPVSGLSGSPPLRQEDAFGLVVAGSCFPALFPGITSSRLHLLQLHPFLGLWQYQLLESGPHLPPVRVLWGWELAPKGESGQSGEGWVLSSPSPEAESAVFSAPCKLGAPTELTLKGWWVAGDPFFAFRSSAPVASSEAGLVGGAPCRRRQLRWLQLAW